MAKIAGKYAFESENNFGAYLEAIGKSLEDIQRVLDDVPAGSQSVREGEEFGLKL